MRAIRNVGTMGVGLSPCTVPAAGQPGFQLGDNEIELGLGIHGEAGVRRTAMAPACELAGQLTQAVAEVLALAPGDRVALLINNLGGTPNIELQLFAGNVLDALATRGLRVERAWCGSFLTALEMAGVSVSLLKLGAQGEDGTTDLARLDAPAQAAAWPAAWQGRVLAEPQCMAPPAGSEAFVTVAGVVPNTPMTQAIEAICTALISAEHELTQLDQVVGDGDLGISLSRGARAVRQELSSYPLANPAATLRALSATLRRAMGGTSGPLYAIMLMRAAAALDAASLAQPPVTPSIAAWAHALQAGCDGVADIGGATEGDRTMLDALVPAARALNAHRSMQQALTAAQAGCNATAQMVARRGRSSYLGQRVVGHIDPGARAVCVWLEALAAQWP